MKKWILLGALSFLAMPAFAQRKKLHNAARQQQEHADTNPKSDRDEEADTADTEAAPDRDGQDSPQRRQIFTSLSEMPAFPGGKEALKAYIAENLQYPDEAREDKIQGKVTVRFVINETGEVSDAVVLQDIGGGCGEEALRLVNEMPSWLPGKNNGQPVSCYYNLPVTFRPAKEDKAAAEE